MDEQKPAGQPNAQQPVIPRETPDSPDYRARPATVNPSQIYPTPKDSAAPASEQRYAPGDLLTNSELEMAGVQGNKASGRPHSREIDIVAGLITLSGFVSLLTYHRPLSMAFSAVYIFIGLGILARSAIARRIVIFVSIFGLLMNILSLLVTSAFLSGKASIIPVLSIFFSIAVQIAVLSVLTWHQNEKEFH